MRINKNIKRDDEELVNDINVIVSHARRGEYSDAASQMNLFLQKFQNFLKAGFLAPDKLKNVTYSLETVFLFQQQNDWVAVADILEFEILEFLK